MGLDSPPQPHRAPGATATAGPPSLLLVVANPGAPGTLAQVFARVPAEVWAMTAAVVVLDPGTQPKVDAEALRTAAPVPVTVLRAHGAGGYGALQKLAYRHALDHGHRFVAVLHGGGQYPPERLPDLLRPLLDGTADASFGCRTAELSTSLDAGMPLIKFLGNRVLTGFENFLLRTPLSELHSGYRAFTTEALRSIPFAKNTDDWHFDTQVIIQLHAARLRMHEVAIGTYASDEIGTWSGVRYAAHVATSTVEYKLHELGLRAQPQYAVRPAYERKQSAMGSHARLLELVGPYPRRVLDVGCGQGELAQELERRGHTVTAVDLEVPKVALREFIQQDVGRALPLAPGRRFDVIILADVLEHVAEPAALLQQLVGHLDRGGQVLVSLPNAVHWSLRWHVAIGRFEYTNRGLLDRGHLRFFTRATATRMFRDCGLEVVRHVTTPVPWENVGRRGRQSALLRSLEFVDASLGAAMPNLFAYQHLFKLGRFGDEARRG